jgi:hypothetical protein
MFHMIPLVFIFTIFSRHLLFSVIFSIAFLATLHFLLLTFKQKNSKNKLTSSDIDSEDDEINLRQDIFGILVNIYHYNVYLCTSICILAVDFNVFPYYFGKTNNHGSSIMDLGVSFFVICHSFKSVKRFMQGYGTSVKIKQLFVGNMSRGIALAALGMIRLAITLFKDKNMDLSYGKHWNFFFTLSIMQVIYKKAIIRAFFTGL